MGKHNLKLILSRNSSDSGLRILKPQNHVSGAGEGCASGMLCYSISGMVLVLMLILLRIQANVTFHLVFLRSLCVYSENYGAVRFLFRVQLSLKFLGVQTIMVKTSRN